MKEYIKNNRLTIEADEGMILTDGYSLFVSKYEFPVGVEKNDIIYQITQAEYEAIQETMGAEYEAIKGVEP